jgi:uncharacterized protein with GYD domain
MATYFMLFRITQQGMQHIKDSPARIEAAKQTCRALGGEVRQFYTLMSQYDSVFIVEAPNDETVAKIALALGSMGNVHRETLRAFSESEHRQLVAGLP